MEGSRWELRKQLSNFFVYTKKNLGPPQVINYPDRGPELGGPDINEIYFGLDWPNTKTRSLEEFWTGNGARGSNKVCKNASISLRSPTYLAKTGLKKGKRIILDRNDQKWIANDQRGVRKQCRFYCKTNGNQYFT